MKKQLLLLSFCLALFASGCAERLVQVDEDAEKETAAAPVEEEYIDWDPQQLEFPKSAHNVRAALAYLYEDQGWIQSMSSPASATDVYDHLPDYMGHVVEVTAHVTMIHEPEEDGWTAELFDGRKVMSLTLTADNRTMVQYVAAGDSSSLKPGEPIKIYGYPVARLNFDNGARTKELLMLGEGFTKTDAQKL